MQERSLLAAAVVCAALLAAGGIGCGKNDQKKDVRPEYLEYKQSVETYCSCMDRADVPTCQNLVEPVHQALNLLPSPPTKDERELEESLMRKQQNCVERSKGRVTTE